MKFLNNIFRLYHNENAIGSAVCINNFNNFYIITARHCLVEILMSEYEIGTTKVTEEIDFGESKPIPFSEIKIKRYINKEISYCIKVNEEYLVDEDNDIIVFAIPAHKFPLKNEVFAIPTITQREHISTSKGKVIGFPAIYDKSKKTVNEYRTYNVFDFSHHSQDKARFLCKAQDIDSYSSVIGVSGGGVFYEDNFCGIETDFFEGTGEFANVNLTTVNSLLRKNNYPEIKNSYVPYTQTSISIQKLQQLFGNACKGWLKERYIPAIENYGVINKAAAEVLYNYEYRQGKIKEIQEFRKNNLFLASNRFDFIKSKTTETHPNATFEELLKLISPFRDFVIDAIKCLKLIEDKLVNEEHIEEEEMAFLSEKDVSFLDNHRKAIVDVFKAFKDINPSSPICNEIKDNNLIKTLEHLSFKDISDYISEELVKNRLHNYIILGLPSSGKTHGTARVVDELLNKKGHPALIISAPLTNCNNWKQILSDSLELGGRFSQSEIFQDFKLLSDSISGSGKTKFLIVIDGVEESIEQDKWVKRVAELENIVKENPFLRFLVTARKYERNENLCHFKFGLVNQLFEIPNRSDYPMENLVEQYFDVYNISDNYAKQFLVGQDPLLLRLFCENYDSISSVKEDLSYKKLLILKLEKLINQFRESEKPVWHKIDDQQIIGISLYKTVDVLSQEKKVERGKLKIELANEIKQNENWSGKILEFFTEHGFMSRIYLKVDELKPEIYYEIGNQVFLDYLLSESTPLNEIPSKAKKAPLMALKNRNIAIHSAANLLSDYDIWVGTNGYWSDDFSERELLIIRLGALEYVSDDIIRRKLPEIETLFKTSISNRNIVFEYFVIPNLDKLHLKLSEVFLHKLLLEFSSVYQRDVFWSSPEYRDKRIEGISKILKRYVINDLLVDAWSLSSLDNAYRERTCRKMVRRSIKELSRFVEVLELIFFSSKDPQIQEDLSSVILGVATLTTRPNSEFKLLVEWILLNVFEESKIIKIHNSVIRYCMRGAVERGYTLGLCNERELTLARPPYKKGSSLLKLDLDFNFKQSEGYNKLLYADLGWYVIENAEKGFFDNYGKKEDALKLLSMYSSAYKEKVGKIGFTVGAAIGFAQELGWKPREQSPSYTQKTHGAKSDWATFEEKYTWLAVHEIQGYLADRLSYIDYSEVYNRILDYGIFVNVVNPANYENIRQSEEFFNAWYIPENFSPSIKDKSNQEIDSWVLGDAYPINIGKWIRIDEEIEGFGDWFSLSMNTKLIDATNTVFTKFESICCFIDASEFDSFIESFRKNPEGFKSYFNHFDSLKATPKTNTYSTVQDVVWMSWVKERESIIDLGNNKIYVSITDVVEDSINEGEQHYMVPSKLLRLGLNIVDTDKNRFFNSRGQLRGIYKKNKTDFYQTNSQEFLAIEGDAFILFCEEKKLKPFWIVWEFRRTTLSKEQLNSGGYHKQHSKMWIVWEENGEEHRILFVNGRFTNYH